MRIGQVLCALASAIALTRCAQSTLTDADRQAFNDLARQEIAAWEAGDAEKWVAVLADDAQVMPPHAPMVTGKDAARNFAQQVFQLVKFKWSDFQGVEIVAAADDFAIARVPFKVTMQAIAGGSGMVDEGKGIQVFRRQADGTWKITLEIWNSNIPARPPAATSTPLETTIHLLSRTCLSVSAHANRPSKLLWPSS